MHVSMLTHIPAPQSPHTHFEAQSLVFLIFLRQNLTAELRMALKLLIILLPPPPQYQDCRYVPV